MMCVNVYTENTADAGLGTVIVPTFCQLHYGIGKKVVERVFTIKFFLFTFGYLHI
jgi:hypothetical protein